MNKMFMVEGLGISVLCEYGTDSMLWWIQEIIRKGGVPKMTPFNDEIEKVV